MKSLAAFLQLLGLIFVGYGIALYTVPQIISSRQHELFSAYLREESRGGILNNSSLQIIREILAASEEYNYILIGIGLAAAGLVAVGVGIFIKDKLRSRIS